MSASSPIPQSPQRTAAAYRFAPGGLQGLEAMKVRIAAMALQENLLGTVILAPEGWNMAVAGEEPAILRLLAALEAEANVAGTDVKWGEAPPDSYRRLKVKIKAAIIPAPRMPGPELAPGGRRITPAELKQWLDEGRDFTFLDTRNQYEVERGTFEGAVNPGITYFRDFGDAASKLPAPLKDRTVVAFCTGGVRCEKAVPVLESLGFKDVFQLDGGILAYFRDVGREGYSGDCFVFDGRRAVDGMEGQEP